MRAEFSATYPTGTDFFLMLDSARIVAAHMGEDCPDELGVENQTGSKIPVFLKFVLFQDCNPMSHYDD